MARRAIAQGVCRDDTGNFAVPEPGDVKIILSVGQSTRYCGGGTAAGNPDVIYKRLDCAAPASCF